MTDFMSAHLPPDEAPSPFYREGDGPGFFPRAMTWAEFYASPADAHHWKIGATFDDGTLATYFVPVPLRPLAFYETAWVPNKGKPDILNRRMTRAEAMKTHEERLGALLKARNKDK